MLKLSTESVLNFINQEDLDSNRKYTAEARDKLISGKGPGSENRGWIKLPSKTDPSLLREIQDAAEKLKSISDIVVVIGIGGSYIGARAVIEAVTHDFFPLIDPDFTTSPAILYAGHNLDENYLADLCDILDERNYSIIVISKSGTTTEPAIAFRVLKTHIENKYGRDKIKERIIVITDKSKGALRKMADDEEYSSFVIPVDIGGRFSVLTPVGLLPIAAAGVDITKLIEGAKEMEELCRNNNEIDDNPSATYASIRNLLYDKGKVIEILSTYSSSLIYFAEWWKQLYGESEGKNGRGIFPASVNFTTDLHSMGQLIQEGERNIFETVINVERSNREISIPQMEKDADNLNYLAGRRLHDINIQAQLGTMMAHIQGNVPNMLITIPELNEHSIGQLIYFFEYACGISGYLLGVNPFDQPGVEVYKKNMFTLLGKPE
jgi:glucose-6-phosphate isomerase